MNSVFGSKPYTFIVRGKPLYVHANLISECSAPLDRMISGQMLEAHQGFALLDDVSIHTFTRFIRWLYTKDYPAAEHTISSINAESQPSSTNAANNEVVEVITDDWGAWGTTKKKDKKKKKDVSEKGSLKESFISRKWEDDAWDYAGAPAQRSNKAPEENYTDVFLSHAELYVFSEKYDIQPLKKLALKKLQQTLAIYTLYPSRVEDVLTLLKYVYAETAASKRKEEDIRTMLMHYVGTEMEVLETHGDIKELLTEDHEMLSDFLAMFAQRIS